jgi:uncharacterized 2Fe-2S/4Fe-4S cluster protein (DUF4445 family)
VVAFTVRFVPDNRSFTSDEPLDLFLAASRCEIWAEQPCGARTVCAKCRVRVVSGDVPVTAADHRLLPAADLAEGWRLGCQFTVASDCVVEIPPQHRAVAPKSFGPARWIGPAFRPAVERAIIDSPRPDNATGRALLDELGAAIAAVRPLSASRPLVERVWERAEASGQLEVVFQGRRLIEADVPGAGDVLGVAVDLGSTSLAAALVDLATGEVLAVTSRLNPQVRYGPDVITRIHFAQSQADGNARLHEAIVGAVGEMIAELVAQTGRPSERVFAATCAGNATMTHSALGADVRPLGAAPYVGIFTREWTVPASALGWPVHPDAHVHLMPMIGRHVGGDTVAATLACDIDRAAHWQMLVDLGTNAEVVIGCRDRIVATSTAAGPAFEGGNISCGMRAAPGAVDAVRVLRDGRLTVGTIASQPPLGICGSGLVDAVAELLRARVIAPSGYLRSREEAAAAGVPEVLARRIVATASGERAVHLAGDVVLSAQDVRQLQLVKGSIAAGAALLLQELGLTADDLDAVLVAGTFGTYLRKVSALAIGLVPAIDPERVHFVGNAAGAGARLALVDARARRRAVRIARRGHYVELAGHPGYEDAFCAAIPFPGPANGEGQ